MKSNRKAYIKFDTGWMYQPSKADALDEWLPIYTYQYKPYHSKSPFDHKDAALFVANQMTGELDSNEPEDFWLFDSWSRDKGFDVKIKSPDGTIELIRVNEALRQFNIIDWEAYRV